MYWVPLLDRPRPVTLSSPPNSLSTRTLYTNLRHMRKSHHRMSIMHLQKVFNTNSPSCQEQHLTWKTLQNTESLLTTKLIPNITGRGQLSIAERSLFSLQLSKGGLNILSPEDRRNDLQWSKDVTSHLDEEDLTTAEAKQHSTVNMIKKQKQEIQKTKLEEVK